MQSEVLTPQEAADFLRCSVSYIHKTARAGEIPYHRLGRELRFVRSELLGWLTASQSKPNEPRPSKKGMHNGPGHLAKLRPQRKVAVLDALRSGATLNNAAQLAGVSNVTLRNWRRDDPQFDADVEKARTNG